MYLVVGSSFTPEILPCWRMTLADRSICSISACCHCCRYHGPRPVNRPNHVWVCNHTSMIDYIILTAYSPFAVIMQLHPGWVGFLQTKVLNCLGCLWFNRTEVGYSANTAMASCHCPSLRCPSPCRQSASGRQGLDSSVHEAETVRPKMRRGIHVKFIQEHVHDALGITAS